MQRLMKSHIKLFIPESQKGSTLILTVWLLMLLSLFALTIGHGVQQRMRAVQAIEIRDDLRAVAEAGVKRGMELIRIKKQVDLTLPDALNQNWSRNLPELQNRTVGRGYFSVMKYAFGSGHARYADRQDLLFGMIDEESKINLNTVNSSAVLTRFFRSAGKLDRDEAAALAESVMDWIDADDESRADGAESRYYRHLSLPYEPKNGPLDVLEELLYVKGMTREIFDRVRPFMTVHSNGTVNINTAPYQVLRAVGFELAITQKILAYRRGPDGIEGTLDDGIFTALEDIEPQLSGFSMLGENERKELERLMAAGRLAVRSENFSIQSVARLPGRKETMLIQCIAGRESNIRFWREMLISAA